MEIKRVTVQDQEYLCDIDLTVEDWKGILQDENFGKYIDTLIKFHSEPNHKSTCKALGDKYNVSPQSFNGTITNFAKAVQKKLNRFEIIGTDGKPTYWIIPMQGKHIGEFFEWTIRPELVQAMEELNLKGKHLLQKIYDEAIENKHWVFFGWFPNYKNQVSHFLTLMNESVDWSEDDLKNLIYTKSNGIADNGNGTLSYIDFQNISAKWKILFPIFKKVTTSNSISTNENQEIQAIIRSCTKRNMKQATNRIISAFLPGLITTTVNVDDFNSVISTLHIKFDDYPEIKNDWLLDNISFIDYCRDHVEFKDPWHCSLYAWYLKEYFENERLLIQKNEASMQKYIDLLLNNKNLILTGAPGTGKTFLAKEIAKKIIGVESDEELKESGQFSFAQFHPSYDYTDFVEGLRPTKPDANGNIGFELKNGIFKNFCEKAIGANVISIGQIKDFTLDNYKSYLQDIKLDDKTITTYIGKIGQLLGGEFYAKREIIDREVYKSLDEICENHDDIKDFDKKNNFHNQFASSVSNLIKFRDSLSSQSAKIDKKELFFVFIIDEINRAEISKVFGELFFSIDEGYRGEKGKVKTQYSNLQDEGDIFYDGFYIPENVFIIGTMNDIDRSVESFDFAMRRRFAWKEIKAIDRISMWDGAIDDWKDEALKRMKSLNSKIETIQGLGAAFHIGPAYFLKLKKYNGNFDQLWENHLEGVLFEYLRGFPDSDLRLNELKTAYEVIIESQSNVENN